ncbi:ArsR/SmtB family transcription factor [Cerasicoccus fimbriatus]|uniref:ArsR/SmtB family transcription factor n=1 Tax=Cerasicoccus fimbriatus TaxID=3014554 RepID=UPI0022B4EADA|nr:metalloregulator ArsR/SmtB family transcription factor [Cerasicoccus sp. TK19100]
MAEIEDELAKQLWAIGDITRLRILRLLPDSADCEHAKNVSQIADVLNLSQPTISHHLRVLRQAGIVQHQKMCRDCYYWVDRDAAREVIERMEELLLNVEPVKA